MLQESEVVIKKIRYRLYIEMNIWLKKQSKTCIIQSEHVLAFWRLFWVWMPFCHFLVIPSVKFENSLYIVQYKTFNGTPSNKLSRFSSRFQCWRKRFNIVLLVTYFQKVWVIYNWQYEEINSMCSIINRKCT